MWCFFLYMNNRQMTFILFYYLYGGEVTCWIIDLVWTRRRWHVASGLTDRGEERDGTFSIKMAHSKYSIYQVYVVFIMGVFKRILAHSRMKRNPFILIFSFKIMFHRPSFFSDSGKECRHSCPKTESSHSSLILQ